MQYFLIQFLQTSEIRLSFLKSMYYFLIYTWQVEGDNDELTWWLVVFAASADAGGRGVSGDAGAATCKAELLSSLFDQKT